MVSMKAALSHCAAPASILNAMMNCGIATPMIV
jgi:hypothetical protein